jgi:cytochrome P450
LSKRGLLHANSAAVKFARAQMSDPSREKFEPNSDAPRRDFLSRFTEAQQKSPNIIMSSHILSLTAGNIFAGSDTTACSLRAVFYFLLRNPPKMKKLLSELNQMEESGIFISEEPLVRWDVVRNLPYLSAVIQEALRCFPAVGMTLERIVPSTGVTLCKNYLPPGTIVGCSAWTVHQEEKVFGADPETFRPERWLESSQDQIKLMSSSLFTFGAGARTCIGKNISLLEIYKLVPAILRSFEVSFVLFF